ncbi:MAG: hypothetical protein K1000chlam2_00710 [Chlamydiae bacterium]|nr:hypothetical protein [Chlamydiota bacterium]
MGIQLMFFCALCIAISNLCMRRSIDAGGTSKAYLMVQLTLSFLIMLLLNPVRTGNYTWDTSMALFGLAGGILLACVMGFLGKALENGPPGLSVALLSCSSVMPILMLVLLFGARFGFYYTLWNALGSVLVITGICWAGWDMNEIANRRKWVLFVSLTFFSHVAYLVFLSWRGLFFSFAGEPGLGLNITAEGSMTQWFMPMIFLSAALIQTYLFFSKEKRAPKRSEVVYGAFGSVANGLGAFLMMRSIEVSTSVEHAMIFPIFSVTLILGCNLWGKFLYKEAVNWKANALCIGGILVGMIDWKVIFN